MYKLEVRNITKKYGNKLVLNDFNISVNTGERVSLLGPSGCGKSTVLNIMAGIIDDYQGSVILNGCDISSLAPNKRNIVIVSQENLLFPHMNVYDNIAFSMKVKKKSKDQIDSMVGKLLKEINLQGYENKKVSQLSGGEKQRIALARALAAEPEVLLLDEAYSSLDTNLREKMRELTIELQKKHQITTILVTHDKEEAMMFGDKMAIVLNGRIHGFDTPQNIYDKPKDRETASFLMRDNFLEHSLGETTETIFVKPEDIECEKAISKDKAEVICKSLYEVFENARLEKDIVISGSINKILYLGAKIQYLADFNGVKIKVDSYDVEEKYTLGDAVYMTFKKYCFFK